MKIKVLVENTTDSDLQCEHGLSLYMEYKDKRILLDAGSTEVFAENAHKMGVDLSMADMALLSHGHYDHSGGFGAFIRENKEAPVYAMESAMAGYASTSGAGFHEIGVPVSVKEVLKDRLVLIDKITQVAEGITLVPHSTSADILAQIGKKAGLYRQATGREDATVVIDSCEGIGNCGEKTGMKDGCEDTGNCGEADSRWQPDDFSHEMSLVLETDKGLVIFNSCSHGGVQNIITEVKEALPGKKIYAYVGGLHMKGRKDGEEICAFPEEEVKTLAEVIFEAGIEVLLTGHCTGEPGLVLLEKYLTTGQIIRLCTGTVYELGGL